MLTGREVPVRVVLLITALVVGGCKPRAEDRVGDSDTGATIDTEEETGDTGGEEPYPDPPVAVIRAPSSAWLGEDLTLDGSLSSDPGDHALLAWEWWCSDGTEASGETVEVSLQRTGEVECTLVVTSETGLDGSAQATVSVSERPSGEPQWTVLVFLAGDNNLEDSALEDLNEMEVVGSTDEVRVVVQLDRSAQYSTADGNWRGSRRFLVAADSDTRHVGSPVLEDLGRVDSGDPAVLAEFLDWGIRAYPAEHYAVVLWDHGWGWDFWGAQPGVDVKGFSSDDSTGSDISVALGEYAAILDTAVAAAGGQLDLVGFDACTMGTWEVAHATAPYAGVFVGSQATEGLDGWDYAALLDALTAEPTMDAATLGATLVHTYFNEADRDATLSVVDTSALAGFTAQLDVLAAVTMEAGFSRGLVGDAQGTQEFEWGWGYDHDIGDWLDVVVADARLPLEITTAAMDLQLEYASAVLTSQARGAYADATGLSLHLPDGRPSAIYSQGAWAEDTLWDELLLDATSH